MRVSRKSEVEKGRGMREMEKAQREETWKRMQAERMKGRRGKEGK